MNTERREHKGEADQGNTKGRQIKGTQRGGRSRDHGEADEKKSD